MPCMTAKDDVRPQWNKKQTTPCDETERKKSGNGYDIKNLQRTKNFFAQQQSAFPFDTIEEKKQSQLYSIYAGWKDGCN